MPVFKPLAALGLAMTLAAPAGATDLDNLTAADRAAFRAEVRAYLLENPEVLMEAIGVLEQRQASAEGERDQMMIAANADALFSSAFDVVLGNPEGDVTIVEFMDYRCGYCRRAHPEVADLIELDGNIRVIVKEFPILGEQSVLAARFAIATRIALGDDAYVDDPQRLDGNARRCDGTRTDGAGGRSRAGRGRDHGRDRGSAGGSDHCL